MLDGDLAGGLIEQRLQFFGLHRFGKQEALHLVAALFTQEINTTRTRDAATHVVGIAHIFSRIEKSPARNGSL